MKKSNSLNENKKSNNKINKAQLVDSSSLDVDFDRLSSESKVKFIVIVVTAIIIVIVCILLIGYFIKPNHDYNVLECKSDEGSVAIKYNNNGLLSYKADGMDFDFKSNESLAKDVGINKYINDYRVWYANNTNGDCSIK